MMYIKQKIAGIKKLQDTLLTHLTNHYEKEKKEKNPNKLKLQLSLI